MKSYVFFDIDGTLLPEGELHIPQNTVNAIKKLKANGHVPFICTGRCYHQAKQYIEEIGAQSYIVSNGQEINLLDKEIYTYDLSNKEKEFLIKLLKDTPLNWGYETRENIYLMELPGVEQVKKQIAGYGIMDVKVGSDKLSGQLKQIWAFGSDEEIKKIESKLLGKFKFFRWNENSIEIIPLEESKGKAVKKILENSEEKIKTYAFGDGFNDMELLEVVDVGVAMGNAREELKAVADYVTENCTDDGITKGLKEYNLI